MQWWIRGLRAAAAPCFIFHVCISCEKCQFIAGRGGAGRGEERRALVRTVIPISWSIHHGSSSSPHHCWGLTEPSSAVCGEPVVGRFTVRTPHHTTTTTTTTTDASPHCGGRARPRPLLHIVLLLLGGGRRLEAGPGHHVNISAPAAPPPGSCSWSPPAPSSSPPPAPARRGGAGRRAASVVP